MRRRDFIKGVGGSTAGWPARRWLAAASIHAPAGLAPHRTAAAQDVANLPIEIVPQIGHSNGVNSVAFSPNGRTIISGSTDKTVKLWDSATGSLIRTFTGPAGSVRSVAPSPDGAFVLTGGGAYHFGELVLWDTATGRAIGTFVGHKDEINSVAFSPDGRFVVSGGGDMFAMRRTDNTVKLWDAATGKLFRSFEGHSAAVIFVGFSPDGLRVLSAGLEGIIKFWEVASGKLLSTFGVGANRVDSIAWSSDSTKLLSGAFRSLSLWDAATGKLIRSFDGVPSTIISLAFSANGAHALSGDKNNTVKLWDTATGKLIRSFDGHSANVSSVAFSPDGKYVLSGGGWFKNSEVLLWDVASGMRVQRFEGSSNEVTAASFSPDGMRALSAGRKFLNVWNATTGKLIRSFEQNSGHVAALAFSRDRTRVLSLENGNVLRLRDTTTGELLNNLDGGAEEMVRCVALSPDGTRALAGGGKPGVGDYSEKGKLRLWDVITGRVLYNINAYSGGGDGEVNSVEFSPDGTLALSGGTSYPRGELILREAATGNILRNFVGHSLNVASVVFSPDGARVLSGSWDRTVKLWDVATGELLHNFEGHLNAIESVAFSPNGAYVLSGSRDNALKLWDATTGRPIRSFVGHSYWVTTVSFSFDGERVLSGSADGTIKVWNARTGELLATLVFGENEEWLSITPEGFFDSSDNGASLLRAARGLEVYSIAQFYQQLYRPDVVRQRLSFDPEINQRVRYAAEKINLKKILASKAPPEIVIASPANNSQTSEGGITVEANLSDRGTDKGGGIGRMEWRVNDVTRVLQDLQQAADGQVMNVSQKLALPEGTSEIKVVAYNRANLVASLPAAVSVTVKSSVPRPKPHLHVLAVGVNEYRDPDIRKLNYSVADANAISAAFALSKGTRTVYENVTVHRPLLDDAVTRSNLEQEFQRLGGIIRPDDVFVLYVAGHGVTDDGQYYFVAHDARIKDNKLDIVTGVGQDLLQQWLTLIPAFRSVLIYDTCESGSIAEDRSAFRTTQRLVAAEKLSRSMGRTVISATTDVKDALEGYKKHGVFTYVLLDAFAQAEPDQDGQITTEALATYLQKNLPELTERELKVRQEPQVKLSGAPFALMPRADIADINRVRS